MPAAMDVKSVANFAADGPINVKKATRERRLKKRGAPPGQHSTVISLNSSDEDSTPSAKQMKLGRQLQDAAAGAGLQDAPAGTGVASGNVTGKQLNAEQKAALHLLLVMALTTKVVGPAGTGKTLVAEEIMEQALERNTTVELLWIAPYSSQVDSAKERLSVKPRLWRALEHGQRVKTAASVFRLPLSSRPDKHRMVAEMSARTKAMLKAPNLKIVLDEVDLLSPDGREMQLVAHYRSSVRTKQRPDGGVQLCEVGDMFQGEPCLSEAEKEIHPEAKTKVVGPAPAVDDRRSTHAVHAPGRAVTKITFAFRRFLPVSRPDLRNTQHSSLITLNTHHSCHTRRTAAG